MVYGLIYISHKIFLPIPIGKRKLFIEAPTGVGKTLSTVFPAVKAIGEEKGERIFAIPIDGKGKAAVLFCMRLLFKGDVFILLYYTYIIYLMNR